MADQSTVLRVRAEVENLEGLNRLRTAVRGVANEAKAGNNDFARLLASIQSLDSAATKSINSLQGQRNAFDALRRSVAIGSDEFKKATAEIARLDQQLAKAEGRQGAGGGRFGRLAQTVGAAASGGVFGGLEGLTGGVIGGIAGGPTGALAGAAIGAQVAQIRQVAAGTADYAAQITKQRLALQLVTKDSGEYNRALQFIDRTSRELAIPQELITEQFTKLVASVKGAGGNVRDAEKAFTGIASGIRGTGGSLEQLNSALTATSQVFSKGKVSAEELRQQIGERLPGAFSLFAKSIGLTPQELDKALEKGQVSLQDFQKFAEQLFLEYGENAKIIADGPDAAGDRLQTSLSRLKESVGSLLKPIGASFQNTFAQIVASIDAGIRKLNEFLGLGKGTQGDINKTQAELDATEKSIRKIKTAIDELPSNRSDLGLRQQFTTQLGQLEARRAQQFARLQALLAKTMAEQGPGREPESKLPGIQQDQKTPKQPRIPVLRIADMTLEAERASALTAKNLRLSELVLDAKKKGFEYDEQILPLLAKGLQFNTQIQFAQETINDLVENKNKLLKFGMSSEEYTARLSVANIELKDAISNRQAYFNQLQAQELEIVQRVNEAREKDIQSATQQVQDLAAKYQLISAEEKRIIDISREIANLEPLKKIVKDPTILKLLDEVIARLNALKTSADSFGKTFTQSFGSAIKEMGNLANNLGAAFGNVFMGMADQLAEFVSTGKASFADFARSALNDLTKIFVRAAFFSGLQAILPGNVFSSLFPKFAMGGIMTPDGPMPLKRYAAGGIANSPQLAMFGEGRQAEAYVPLPDGRSIPVTMQGGGQGVNVVVNVDAAGSSVQGDGPNAKALGVAISSAVKAEILKQQRPGGYLAGTR